MKRFFVPMGLVLALLASSASSASAMTYSGLLKVSQCKASLNLNTFAGGGWGPGYYPYAGRPYYWGSVYGYTYYQPPVTTTDPQLGIDYTNVSPKAMKEIEFGLVANNNLVAEVKDVGTFSPGVEIKHKFGVSANIFPLQTALAQCVPLKITFEDGTKWKSPHLAQLKSHLHQYTQ